MQHQIVWISLVATADLINRHPFPGADQIVPSAGGDQRRELRFKNIKNQRLNKFSRDIDRETGGEDGKTCISVA